MGQTTDLEQAMLDEVNARLDAWQRRYRGRPAAERTRLLLLALEREQVVSVAYREGAVAGRVDALAADEEVRALIRQALIWIWKDEELHREYLRGRLLQEGTVLSHAVAYGYQLQGALSGWASSTANHRVPRSAPVQTGAAAALIGFGRLTGQVPPLLGPELTFRSLRRYFELSVALEASAALGYERYDRVAIDAEEREAIAAIHSDEMRHIAAFRVLAHGVTDDGGAAAHVDADRLRAELEAISPYLVPAAMRTPGGSGRPRRFGSGCQVAVRTGGPKADRVQTLHECLEAAGLASLARRARTAAIRVSFMLGYDRRDRSNVNDVILVAGLARYLRAHGVEDVAVLEAPTVYDRYFAGRSVEEVAGYFGFGAPEYRVVDIGADLRPFHFDRGFVQNGISATWLDADLRIVMPKLRTNPTEFAHLSLSTLEGTTGSIPSSFYAGRSVDFRSATMMLLDVAPPDFAVVDGWAPVAQGPFGVMGCDRPADVRCIYAGGDALAVDEAVLADLGITDPRRAPIMRTAYHWFGLAPCRPEVDGDRPPLARLLSGAHSSRTIQLLGTAGYPIYMYLSDGGSRFLPAMDTEAFPPRGRPSITVQLTRRLAQVAFGLRPALPTRGVSLAAIGRRIATEIN